jgi:hypothetical protein
VSSLTAALRRLVRERAELRCEYCLLAEDDAYLPHEPDHVIAVKHGGVTDASNLALACFDCNRYKGSDIASVDPHDGRLTPLFNPRTEDWAEHFQADAGRVVPITADAGRVVPITPVGRVTVALLQINLTLRVEVRDELTRLGHWPLFR